jgi:hypothetical protein
MKKPVDVSGKGIRERLENWGKFQRGGSGGGSAVRAKETRTASPYGGQGYQCMTGVICNLLATAANGQTGWKPVSRSTVDVDDAKRITMAFIRLNPRQQSILKWCYVFNAQPQVICRRLGIRAWPASHFLGELRSAENTIQKVLDSIANGNTIPSNNLFPSDQTSERPTGGVAVPGGNEEALD